MIWRWGNGYSSSTREIATVSLPSRVATLRDVAGAEFSVSHWAGA